MVPSISQIAGVPSSFCHRMSDLPSPLKSPVPLMCQLGPGLNEPAAPLESTFDAVHQPDRGRAVVVLPQDVGLAVAVEVAGRLDLPARPRIERAGGAAGQLVEPSISQIAGVPSSCCHRMSDLPSPLKSPVPLTCQLGPGLNGPAAPVDSAVEPSISQIAGVPSSFCQRMSDLPSPLKSPVALTCQLGPGLKEPAKDRRRRYGAGAVHQPDRGRAIVVLPEDVASYCS